MKNSSSELEKTKSTFNSWNDARILTHVASNRTPDFAHLKIFDPHVMPRQSSNRNSSNVKNENNYYNTADRPPDYLKTNNTINTVHLQNPYKPPQRLEGFPARDHSKNMYRSQDFTLRSRYHNNLLAKNLTKESIPNRSNDQENEKVERLLKKKKPQLFTELGELTKQYCTNSTLHGLRYIGNSELSIIERLFWIISFITALGMATYYIYYLYQKWNGSPIIISLSPEPVSLNEFPFPSITICNMNNVKKTEAIRIARGHDWPDLNITYPSSSVDWNAEKGYDASMPADVIPWRPYGSGLFYGLTLVLDVEASEYYCSSTAGMGFKMLLHNPVETPKIADFSFSITPGEETRVIIRPRISTANPSIISIPQNKRKCFFTTERKLRYYRTYTQRNCILECEANYTQKLCHCVQYYMPKAAKTPICGKKDESCATLARKKMEIKLYVEDLNPINLTEVPSCNCWPGCFEINYRIELSQNKLSSTFNIDKQYVKKNLNYFTENAAVVHLFFVDSQFTKYVKNELYGFTEFLSSTGGLLGLFLGFSFLSFMEIVYFATMRLWCRLHNRRESQRPITLQIHPLDDRRKVIYPFAN
ncbi:Amiloride-sensitive cation channel 4-A [Camponotus floridanus]|uniref:Amiloride-sensitive cation channel 4-A n=1 Tax=Camponotus floridanus TaxID=104421 RepID=E2A269_CAMFO|nr:Amiloride-sensitive cation channel 4-A [Camponotus floridanus]